MNNVNKNVPKWTRETVQRQILWNDQKKKDTNIIITLLFLAVTTESPETTDVDDDDDDDNDEPFWGAPFWNGFFNYFTAIGDWIWREEQILSTFDTQTCSSPQTGPCTFRGFQLIDTNCTIYTIGNCSRFINEWVAFVHILQLNFKYDNFSFYGIGLRSLFSYAVKNYLSDNMI